MAYCVRLELVEETTDFLVKIQLLRLVAGLADENFQLGVERILGLDHLASGPDEQVGRDGRRCIRRISFDHCLAIEVVLIPIERLHILLGVIVALHDLEKELVFEDLFLGRDGVFADLHLVERVDKGEPVAKGALVTVPRLLSAHVVAGVARTVAPLLHLL